MDAVGQAEGEIRKKMYTRVPNEKKMNLQSVWNCERGEQDLGKLVGAFKLFDFKFEYSFNLRDDLYRNKYDCCWKCYMHFVEGREERWENIDQRVEFLGNFYKGKDNG